MLYWRSRTKECVVRVLKDATVVIILNMQAFLMHFVIVVESLVAFTAKLVKNALSTFIGKLTGNKNGINAIPVGAIILRLDAVNCVQKSVTRDTN